MTDSPDQTDDQDSGPMRALREENKRLAAEVKARDEQIAQAQSTMKEATFIKAGIPDDKLGAVFRKAYEGDLTPEAISAEWAELGVPASQPAPDVQVEQPSTVPPTASFDAMTAGTTGAPAAPDLVAQIAATENPAEIAALMEQHGRVEMR